MIEALIILVVIWVALVIYLKTRKSDEYLVISIWPGTAVTIRIVDNNLEIITHTLKP